MSYTQNESIDGLTAITPTTDDLVVTMDQAEVGVAKTSTLASIYDLFKTTYDTVYAKYLGDADFYKYSIVTSVASGNLTVALKNYEGNDPTPTKPVKIMIGGVVRTITSALGFTMSAGVNWLNLGSTELATKEVDIFTYLFWYSTSGGGATMGIGVTRLPGVNIISEVHTLASDVERGFSFNFNTNQPTSTTVLQNIGRFNATLSAGGAYTWSIPATSVIVNSPQYFSLPKDFVPTITAGTSTGITNIFSKYNIDGKKVHCEGQINISTPQTTINEITVTLPMSSINQIALANYLLDSGSDVNGVGFVNFSSMSLRKVGNFSGFLVFRYSADYHI